MGFLIPLLVATAFGFLAGMGVGGGSLLLLWLTQVTGMDPAQARLLNLLFFLPAAAVSIILNVKGKRISREAVIPAVIAGCAAAVIFTLIGRQLDRELMKKLLGALLILTGLREIFYRRRNAR